MLAVIIIVRCCGANKKAHRGNTKTGFA